MRMYGIRHHLATDIANWRCPKKTEETKDFHLDLLFYNRKLRRPVTVELKIGEFKAAYKGQMELYLRWLDKHEREPEKASAGDHSLHRQEARTDRFVGTVQIRHPLCRIPDQSAAACSVGETVATGGMSSGIVDQTRESIEVENLPNIFLRELKSSSDKLCGATTLVLAAM